MLAARRQREWLQVKVPECDGEPDLMLPPWLLPFEWECGPVGGDIERYLKRDLK